MLKLNFLPKFSIGIILAFILFTIIGTLSHEYGHIVVAKYFGYETKLNYGSMNYFHVGYFEDEDVKELEKIEDKHKDIDFNDVSEEVKLRAKKLYDDIDTKFPYNKTNSLWITIGGPAQTLLTSTIGLAILFVRRKKRLSGFKMIDWLAVFMSLFALREVFNFVQALFSSIVFSKSNFYGDEFRISRYLSLNEWIIPIITLVIGLFISFYVIFKIIPLKYRFTFILSGLVGGILGFAIWFGFLGETLFNL